MTNNRPKHSDAFWAMICVFLLDYLHAPITAPLSLIALWGLVWALSAYADHLQAKLDREHPDWPYTSNRSQKP